jgi:3-phenylpropionate/trans-cinnamate dioxygenase ferredoxin reductase component
MTDAEGDQQSSAASTPAPDGQVSTGGGGRAVVVVGAGLAGLGAVRALRGLGYDGRVVLVGEEPHAPYDRPPLSKELLAGTLPAEALSLAAPQDADLDVEVRTGARAVALDVGARRIRLDSGELVGGEGVVIATGARARLMPGPSLAGVHTLRTLDDALALRADLTSGARLVVIGAGFVGAEVASTARLAGLDVTVLEAVATPLAVPLGERFGAVVARLHADHGTRLLTGVPVAALVAEAAPRDGAGTPGGSRGEAAPAGGGARVRAVRLADGREVPADVVVVGIGSLPNVEWLAGSGLDVTGGVLTDAAGGTGAPGVVATGDCTRRWEPLAGGVVHQEHWTNALHHPHQAVASLLGLPAPRPPVQAQVPYFWSDQYGTHVQFAGHRLAGDDVEVVEGDVEARSFVAEYRRQGAPVALLAMNSPRGFGRRRRALAAAVADARS